MQSRSQLDKCKAAMDDGYNKYLGGLVNSMLWNSADLFSRNQDMNAALLDSNATISIPPSSLIINGPSSNYFNSVMGIDGSLGMAPNGLYPSYDARTSSGLLSAFNVEHYAQLLAESGRMGVPMMNTMNLFPMRSSKLQRHCVTPPLASLERKGEHLLRHFDISSISNHVLQTILKTSETKRVVGKGRSVPLPEGTIRRIVLTLTTLVSQEISNGYSEFDESKSNTCIIQALEEFAGNVILPSMLKSSTMSADKYKITVVTLLLLREVMIQNSQIILGMDGDIRDSNEHNEAEEEEEDENHSNYPRRIATKIIFAAIDNSTNNPSTSKRIREAFESICAMYEKTNGKNKPLVLLELADFKIAGITKGGGLPLKKSLSNRKRQEKVMAWKVRRHTKQKPYNRVA